MRKGTWEAASHWIIAFSSGSPPKTPHPQLPVATPTSSWFMQSDPSTSLTKLLACFSLFVSASSNAAPWDCTSSIRQKQKESETFTFQKIYLNNAYKATNEKGHYRFVEKVPTVEVSVCKRPEYLSLLASWISLSPLFWCCQDFLWIKKPHRALLISLEKTKREGKKRHWL